MVERQISTCGERGGVGERKRRKGEKERRSLVFNSKQVADSTCNSFKCVPLPNFFYCVKKKT